MTFRRVKCRKLRRKRDIIERVSLRFMRHVGQNLYGKCWYLSFKLATMREFCKTILSGHICKFHASYIKDNFYLNNIENRGISYRV